MGGPLTRPTGARGITQESNGKKSSGRLSLSETESREKGSRVPCCEVGTTFAEGGNQGVAFVLILTARSAPRQARRERKRITRRARASAADDRYIPIR